MQCFADVNIGSHLSGGIDSSLITAIASKFKKTLKLFMVTSQKIKNLILKLNMLEKLPNI